MSSLGGHCAGENRPGDLVVADFGELRRVGVRFVD
jgi:hypothetical protein